MLISIFFKILVSILIKIIQNQFSQALEMITVSNIIYPLSIIYKLFCELFALWVA